MTTPDAPLISHVSDTARWVAFYRAMESERPDAIFRDPYARRLAGPQGEAIARGMKHGLKFAWPMIVRTAVLDELIQRSIREHGVEQVLNVAAGLDARPWRLPLPSTLRWIDVDLPAMLDHKTSELRGERPVCHYEAVKLDLSDVPARRQLFARVGAEGRRTLVMTEGLLVYLPPASVAELARDLHEAPSFALWLTDLASPELLEFLEKKTWSSTVRAGNAPFLFAPAESTGFFEPYGWREVEWRSMFYEGIRLRRTVPFARFWALLARLGGRRRQEKTERFSGIALLERS
ncbi:MAG: class I SAM-dependent methyltransferase [Gemmatimonadales bacterium]